MTLKDQLEAAILHRDTEARNYDAQIAFVTEHRALSLAAHDKAVERIKAQIEAHLAFIGGTA